MATGNSYYQRKPGRNAKQKKEFRGHIEKLKRLAAERRYTKRQIASEFAFCLVAAVGCEDCNPGNSLYGSEWLVL
jgi:hypothetical protein